jgi:lycopene beta-cyclase
LLQNDKYDSLLNNYLTNHLGISNYFVLESEYGVIPMTNYRFKSNEGNVINMGTAAGWTKASSGFTFQFIQKNTFLITESLVRNKFPVIKKSIWQKRFDWYDATFLNVLFNKKLSGKDIFQQLFSKQKTPTLLRFLDNNSNLKEEIQIMKSVPINVFLPAALKELFGMLIRN